MSKTITNLSSLKINYLTSQQYEQALDAGEINSNEMYLTPASTVDSLNLQVINKNLIFTLN